MIIELYSNKAEKNQIGKMPQELVKSLSGVLKEVTNVTDPIFKVTTLTPEDISKINYVYVPSFSRYYFVNQITFVRNGLYEISCHVDVLESYKDDILNLNCRISRQTQEFNLLLPDNEVELRQDSRVIIKKFNNSINFTPTLVMVTAGGHTVESKQEVNNDKV